MMGFGGSGGPQPPSWAGTSSKPWNPISSVYNDTAATKQRSRYAMGRAAAGIGQFHVAIIGQSLECAFNGNGLTQDYTKSWPRVFAQELATLLGGISMYDGIVPATGCTDRWTLGGLANTTTAASYITFNGGGTAQITLSAGQDIWVAVAAQNAAGIAWTIDGVAQAATPSGGGAVIATQHVAGQANTAHTLAFTGPASVNYLSAVASLQSGPGIVLHNLALGGASAAFGGAFQSWTDNSSGLSLNPARIGMLTTLGITPDLVIIDLLNNDAFHSVSVATAAAALASIIAQFPNSDIILIAPTAAQWQPYQQAIYAQANTSNCRVFDWADLLGGLANATAQGWIGPDGIHPQYSAHVIMGRTLAAACMG
jgi:hypothetical protein